MTPTIGRIVLWNDEHLLVPAVVHGGEGDVVTLFPLAPNSLLVEGVAKGGEPGAPALGTWNWPRREE